MKIAVITAYSGENPEQFERAAESVRSQSHPATHYIVFEGIAPHRSALAGEKHIRITARHGDKGATSLSAGAISALNSGFDAIAFLEPHCWFAEAHLQSLADAMRAQKCAAGLAPAASPPAADGTAPRTSDDFDVYETSSLLIGTGAAFLLPLWAMIDRPLAPFAAAIALAHANAHGVHVARSALETVRCDPERAAGFADWRQSFAQSFKAHSAARQSLRTLTAIEGITADGRAQLVSQVPRPR